MKFKKITISAIVIAKNEEENISDCLKSLQWADEILVIDNESSDDTSKIARKMGATVISFKNGTYSDRKNFAASKARGNWLLYVDADERATSSLCDEIKSKIQDSKTKFQAFAIPRRNVILGREMKHGGWWPDYVKHLLKKETLRGWEGELHEEPIFKGELGYLDNPLLHLKYDNLSDMVNKTNQWSEVEAGLMHKANHPQMTIPRFITAVLREFWLRMIQKKAFMDGVEGIMYALYQVYSKFISYAKLWQMQLK